MSTSGDECGPVLGELTESDGIVGFDAFYRAEHAGAVRLVRLLTGSADVGEDLAHEAFIRVHRHLPTLDNPGAYLHTATVNICRNWHRSRSREAHRLARLEPSALEVSEEAHELDTVLASLPYRQRAVLVLRYWLDLSERDISVALGCREGTVKSLHSRALSRLRKEIHDEP